MDDLIFPDLGINLPNAIGKLVMKCLLDLSQI